MSDSGLKTLALAEILSMQGRFWLQQFGVASGVATSAFGGPRIPDDIMYY